MKTVVYVMLAAFVLLESCKKEETTAPSNVLSATTIQGTWKVTVAEGTEWENGVGVTTPRAADPGTVDLVFNIGPTSAIITKGTDTFTFSYTLTVVDATIFFPPEANTGLGLFAIKDFDTTSMNWEQRDLIAADNEMRTGPGTCECEQYSGNSDINAPNNPQNLLRRRPTAIGRSFDLCSF